ncbi:MAG: histidine kinase [Rubrivivax sp.]
MTPSSPPAPADPGPETQLAPADSAFDASAFEQSLARRDRQPRWIGWRLRTLVLAALLGCSVVFAFMHALAHSAFLDVAWQAGLRGAPTLQSGASDELQALAGRRVQAIGSTTPGGEVVRLEDLALQRSARWLVDDARRARYVQQQDRLAHLFAQGRVVLHLDDGARVEVATPARGYGGLGPAFWPLTAFALLLFLNAAAVLLLRPGGGNLLYAAMAWCQALNLLWIASEPSRGLGQPAGFAQADLLLRSSLDIATAALALAAYALYPLRVPRAGLFVAVAAGAAFTWAAWQLAGDAMPRWWPTQALLVGLGALATAVIAWSNRIATNPFAAVMRRFTFIAVATLALVSLAIEATADLVGPAAGIATFGAITWHLFFASLLLLVPFLSRSRRVLREFSLLTGIGTVATSLALIFVALFSLGPLAALGLALGLALTVYAAARQWILNQMVGARVLTTERTFEQLYRVAREVQERPEDTAALLARLLQDLFDPQETLTVPRRLVGARAVGGGTALYVPLPSQGGGTDLDQVLIMRHASRGKRIFTQDDARLAERVVEQLLRAVAYDRAVERGRAEERLRIAQDLHDDIGARLLTLMYKAADREMEEYVRHTLQDLKTLTRGLAASQHRLSDAAGEWKADLEQRLAAARLRLGWTFRADADVTLSVVQWSGLTRILRELVSNVIAHAQASRVDVDLTLEGRRLVLTVADDGRGGDPASWSHGLGLGGVRKRVRALGGSVGWMSNGSRGIRCEVRLDDIGPAEAASAPHPSPST